MKFKLTLLFGIALAAHAATQNFNPDWKFIKADPAGAAEHGFDDSSWSAVSLPHTFNDVDTFDDWSTPGHVGEMNLWAGRTWYRKTFVLPEADRGKKVFIEFEAVRQIAEVYINGKLLGISKTGFIPFGFDLTPHLRYGGAKNVIAVMADNRFTQETEMAKIIRTELPWNSPHWHPAHGGIYRNVYLHVADPLHITLPLYSFLQTAGPYVYASDIAAGSAKINIEIPVQNERSAAASAEIVATVFDRAGRAVLELKQPAAITAGGQTEVKLSGVLAKPQLWEPAYPYLYKVVCVVRVGGRVVDSQEIPLGIRTARWDANAGLFLNGQHLKLHGWGQKPTDEWPGLGNAQPDWMHFFTLQLMKEAGGNFVRWGHCAAGAASLNAGDRLGIIADQPGVDGEGDAIGDAWTIRAAAFRDTLIYFRNHPSILIWEGGNQKVTREHAKELRGYMDRYDPHGGRVYAHRRADETTAEFMDIGIGTEGGREIARLPVVEGEYDREESPRRVWDDFSPPNFGYPEAKGQTYQLTSEQYAVNQIAQFVKKLGAPNHAGGANWIFSDSTSGGRVSTEVARAGGEVDGVRIPKEAYYVCRTMFRDDPQVHIIGHWTYPANTKKPIYVASNGDDVELFLNGRSLGHGKVSDRYLFTFPETAFEPGELKAVASRAGKTVATHTLHTVGAPVALRMTSRTGPKGWQADGSDIVLVDVEAVDAKGDRVPTYQQRVDFTLEGPGVWRGGYNSGKIKSTNNPYLDLEAGINRVAVRATRTAGTVTLRATAKDLKPATVTLRSVPMSDGLPELPIVVLPATPPVHVTEAAPPAATKSASASTRFVNALSYSGPGGGVHVETDAQAAKRPYIDDDDARFDTLPAALRGHDYVQASNADRSYSAVDLMELAVKPNTVVSVAHDNRLPKPEWLTRQFKPTTAVIEVKGKPMQVFERRTDRAESLTLGSNCPEGSKAVGNMYVVFVGGA
jgi:beta-galactosidase